MRKIGKKILLPVVCVIALVASTFGMLSVSGKVSSGTVTSVYDTDKDGVVTAWDVIERDGYIEGCWYPWLTHSYLGSSLTANPDNENNDTWGSTDYWQDFNKVGIDNLVEGDAKASEAQLKMEIFNLKSLGFNMMAFMGSPWGEGTIHDLDTWEVTGVREDYLTNMRRLLNICREVGMPVVWYIHCHSSAVPNYIDLDLWYRINSNYGNEEWQQSYAENFVKPVCGVLSEYRDVVVMVGLTDELENEITDSELGNHVEEGDREQYGVNQEDAVKFQAAIGQMVKQVMPDMPTTFASNKNDFAMYADSMLDMVGRNQYSSGTSATDLKSSYPVGPMLATEYGTGDGKYGGTEDKWGETLTGKRDAFLKAGYTGFFHWAYQPTFSYSDAGGNQYLKTGATTPYDFRKGMYEGYYWADAKMAELKKDNHTAGGPSAMYHYGGVYKSKYTAGANNNKVDKVVELNGKVFWIQPKGKTDYKVERTTDGGATWTVVNGGVTIDTENGSYRYCMADPNPVTKGTVQYRITANNQTSYTNVWEY